MLEILVVLAIIGLLFGLGTAGLMRLKDTMSAEQGLNDITSFLKSEKNKANINVISESLKSNAIYNNLRNYIFGTKITFILDNSNIVMYKTTCWRSPTSSWDFSNNTQCLNPSEAIKSIGGIMFNTTGITPTLVCSDIIFENLTEKIILKGEKSKCSINIITENYKDPAYRTLNFNALDGYYEVL